jgi:hypothetical protein
VHDHRIHDITNSELPTVEGDLWRVDVGKEVPVRELEGHLRSSGQSQRRSWWKRTCAQVASASKILIQGIDALG